MYNDSLEQPSQLADVPSTTSSPSIQSDAPQCPACAAILERAEKAGAENTENEFEEWQNDLELSGQGPFGRREMTLARFAFSAGHKLGWNAVIAVLLAAKNP